MLTVSAPPEDIRRQHEAIYTEGYQVFLTSMLKEFSPDFEKLYSRRKAVRKNLAELALHELYDYLKPEVPEQSGWFIEPLPERAQCRKLDIGDVSPVNLEKLTEALTSGSTGVQVDFDDGHCPTWRNQIQSHYNLLTVSQKLDLKSSGVMMLRPRAWNMTDYQHCLDDIPVPGTAIDFAFIAYHLSAKLHELQVGPFIYLSKLENSEEASLWNKIFNWVENQLKLPVGCFKACVLIENVLAACQMESILYELRTHSLGLNCGIWDYCASFISVFGQRSEFVIPDRSKYVDMTKHFLKSYLRNTVSTCHRHGAPVTSGMAASVIPEEKDRQAQLLAGITRSKSNELAEGVDGCLVYDTRMVLDMMSLINSIIPSKNRVSDGNTNHQMASVRDLLQVPQGGVTLNGLKKNVKVSIFFIYAWLKGDGVIVIDGAAEDSATADISRLQIWQWLHHSIQLEGEGGHVDMKTITELSNETVSQHSDEYDQVWMSLAREIFLELTRLGDEVQFITTFLNEHDRFKAIHGHN